MFEPSPALLQVWQAWQTVQDALDRGDCRGRSTHEVEAWARLWAKCQIEAGQIPSLPPEPWQTEVKRKLG